MLTFNEGVPGAGKTYDAIAEHLLPALRNRRKVWARINGLNFELIAEATKLTVGELRELLVPISSEEIRRLLRAERDDAGEFVIPDKFRNSLVLIDEAHEFWVASRDALPQDEEQFFAIHRHYGMDIVLMTQWYKRLHTALRARIERKNVFQKLTAVGMEKSYHVTFWHTVAPDKYEKVGGVMRKYKPEIFALYKGVADGGVQTEVYAGGARTVWASVLPIFIVGGLLVGVGLFFVIRFFSPKSSPLVKTASPSISAPVPSAPAKPVIVQVAGTTPSRPSAPAANAANVKQIEKEPDVTEGMTAEQAYVWKLAKTARVRVAIKMGEGSSARGLIEFRERNQPPTEALDTRQLKAMGIGVVAKEYGFLLTANGESIVATAWPTDEPQRPRNAELYRLNPPGSEPPATRASEASAAPAVSHGVAIAPSSTIAAYGGSGLGDGVAADVGEFKMRD